MSSCTLCRGDSEKETTKCSECGDPFCYYHMRNHGCEEDRSVYGSTNDHVDIIDTLQYGLVILGHVFGLIIISLIMASVTSTLVEDSIMGISLSIFVGGILFISGLIGIQYKIIHDAVFDALNG